jgi:hypothetical protein
MVAVPALIPVMAPVVELIVAIDVAPEDHVPPDTLELKVELLPIQIACVPDKVPAVA